MKYKVKLEELDRLLVLSKEIAVLEYQISKLKIGSSKFLKLRIELNDLMVLFNQVRGNIQMPSNFVKEETIYKQ